MFSTTNQQHELSTIKSIQFGILSDEQIRKNSAVEITDGTFYDSNGDPKLNSLFDPRMGVIERARICKTCEQDYIFCPGHFGHISLARPVFNTQFDDFIIKIAKCICVRCSKLLINRDHPQVKNIVKNTKGRYGQRFDKIFRLIFNTLKVERCGTTEEGANPILDNCGCGAIQPSKYTNDLRSGYLTFEWRTDSGATELAAGTDGGIITQKMNPEMVLALFKRISEEDALTMGFHKNWCLPHWLIMQSVPVVPPACRPSVRQYNGQRSEDDITHKYNDIIKHNNELKNLLASGGEIPEQHVDYKTMMVQYHVSTLINNDDKLLPQSTTRAFRPTKGITERLKGKDGRIRNNLMGKRVDFSARSVISPDANIKVSELGVPMEIAMNLTYPEIVCKYNINEMYKLVRNGNNVYPGAKSIKYAKTGNIRLLIDSNLDDIVLEYGDVVNRHLRDQDYVLFNRQPSLHKMSMMGHKIRVMAGKTFRLNTDSCEPYNADF